MQVDESNNRILIVERRHEWKDGSSSLLKSCYIQPLTRSETSRYFHCDHYDHNFDLENTKFHDYSLSSKAFIDMISDISGRSRLRIASCSAKLSIDENGPLCPCRLGKEGPPAEGIKEHLTSHEARLWPSDLPMLPNFLLEAKGPDGSLAVACILFGHTSKTTPPTMITLTLLHRLIWAVSSSCILHILYSPPALGTVMNIS